MFQSNPYTIVSGGEFGGLSYRDRCAIREGNYRAGRYSYPRRPSPPRPPPLPPAAKEVPPLTASETRRRMRAPPPIPLSSQPSPPSPLLDPGLASAPASVTNRERAAHKHSVVRSGVSGLQTCLTSVFGGGATTSAARGTFVPPLHDTHPRAPLYDTNNSATHRHRASASPRRRPRRTATPPPGATSRDHVEGIPPSEQRGLLCRAVFSAAAVSSTSVPSSVDALATPATPASRDAAQWVLSLRPAAVEPYPASDCQVCLRRFADGEDVVQLPCRHIFHARCIVHWLRRQGACPCCRADVRAAAAAAPDDNHDSDAEPILSFSQ